MIPKTAKSILFLFLDGVGIGREGSHNPFHNLQLPGFTSLSEGKQWTADSLPDTMGANRVFRQIDARLGVEGLPQSGTGQATLFTGINCATLAGRHYGPFPHSTSRPVLAEHNIFGQVQQMGHLQPPSFLNAYPERFFELARKRDRWSVTTRCCLDANLRIRSLDDLEAGQAIAADIHGQGLGKVAGRPVTPVTEELAAKRMADLAETHSFLLFEYFMTDKVGHSQDASSAKDVLESLDRLLLGLIKHLDFERTTLVLTSDHGNLEDLGTKTHTMNPVPLVAQGASAHHFDQVQDLTGVTPAILRALGNQNTL
jgi:2,3-bisphosphoglycerate-independent phosphoglycerate mutase